MSRLGRIPITLPPEVRVTMGEGNLVVEGPLGRLQQPLPPDVVVEPGDGSLRVKRRYEGRRARMMQGLIRSLTANMVTGVSKGFEKVLEIVGIGYRAEVKGDRLVLSLGYSHPIEYPIPEGIKIDVERATRITIRGIDKCLVGQTAAEIRSLRKPEPYKGKGIKYIDEKIRKKVGKAGVK